MQSLAAFGRGRSPASMKSQTLEIVMDERPAHLQYLFYAARLPEKS